jgi:deoxyribodipyrimidine photo-lyase
VGTVVVLFTRDLRVRDHPALDAACRTGDRVVCLFVLDDAVLARFGAPNRVAFLLESLDDLDASLRARGNGLVVRRGDTVDETMRCCHDEAASAVFVSEDVSAYARQRELRLHRACREQRLDLQVWPGVTVAPPGSIVPTGGQDHFRVFTPYWARWRAAPRRSVLRAPPRVPGTSPPQTALRVTRPVAPRTRLSRGLPSGGETAGRARLTAWLRGGPSSYGALHDELAADATSRLSAYLHFGCVSALEVVQRAAARAGAEPFVRQLCWRDFHHQLHAARPDATRHDIRTRGDRWRSDPDAFEAWRAGRTGYPLVDAGMRQLQDDGFMHNRARLVTASFLVKHLYLDWRLGAGHFAAWLVDGDVASNVGNWQWVAGTGADTRPNRVFNPVRQALRFDPAGDYVRRWVPELAGLDASSIHEPWRLGRRRPRRYPLPIVDHEHAVERFRAARAGA